MHIFAFQVIVLAVICFFLKMIDLMVITTLGMRPMQFKYTLQKITFFLALYYSKKSLSSQSSKSIQVNVLQSKRKAGSCLCFFPPMLSISSIHLSSFLSWAWTPQQCLPLSIAGLVFTWRLACRTYFFKFEMCTNETIETEMLLTLLLRGRYFDFRFGRIRDSATYFKDSESRINGRFRDKSANEFCMKKILV